MSKTSRIPDEFAHSDFKVEKNGKPGARCYGAGLTFDMNDEEKKKYFSFQRQSLGLHYWKAQVVPGTGVKHDLPELVEDGKQKPIILQMSPTLIDERYPLLFSMGNKDRFILQYRNNVPKQSLLVKVLIGDRNKDTNRIERGAARTTFTKDNCFEVPPTPWSDGITQAVPKIEEGCELYVASELDENAFRKLPGKAAVLTDDNNVYFVVDQKMVKSPIKGRPLYWAKIGNRQGLDAATSTTPAKVTDNDTAMSAILKEVTDRAVWQFSLENVGDQSIDVIAVPLRAALFPPISRGITLGLGLINEKRIEPQRPLTDYDFSKLQSVRFYARHNPALDNQEEAVLTGTYKLTETPAPKEPTATPPPPQAVIAADARRMQAIAASSAGSSSQPRPPLPPPKSIPVSSLWLSSQAPRPAFGPERPPNLSPATPPASTPAPAQPTQDAKAPAPQERKKRKRAADGSSTADSGTRAAATTNARPSSPSLLFPAASSSATGSSSSPSTGAATQPANAAESGLQPPAKSPRLGSGSEDS